MAVSNVDLATVGNYGNTGNIFQNIEPGIPKAIALVPKGTTIPATAFVSQSAFQTYVNNTAQGFKSNTRSTRWFILNNLDTFKDETKAMGTLDTGLNQMGTIKFNTKYTFRALTNKANHQEMMSFDNTTGYDAYVWDANTCIWGQNDSTAGGGGMTAWAVQQFRVMDWKAADTQDGLNQYFISIQFKNRIQANENFAIWNTGLDSDNITGLINVRLFDVTATLASALGITVGSRTDMVVIMKGGQNSIDFGKYYQSSLTQACFVMSNLTTPATVTKTMTAGTVVVASQEYNYLWFVFSAITATNVCQIATAAPSVLNGIISNANLVTEIVAAGVDGQNAAVHTF